MEDLLQHCMRELAFDGDLGCDVSRLRHFIHSFYASQSPPGKQTVDDTFHAFIWALLVQQPSVRVGLVPQGSTIEVYIAPQLSKRKKVAKPKKKQLVPEPAPFPALDGQSTAIHDDNPDPSLSSLQLIVEAATWSLDQLIQQYGNGLRVAVDPETSFRATTGSHTRPAKLSPMVYTALQFISRGREAGLSVVNLGKKTGYDQKTCFYLVKQLLELDLIVKLGQGGPGGGNVCIHRYFYSRSTFWEGVRREEGGDDDDEDEEHQEQPAGNEVSTDTRPKLQFDPIDSRHLASTQLIKSRIVRLLKNSENGLHVYQNLIVNIGFVKPTRRDRRFFIVRIRELIRERVIEKVMVPGSSRALCIRLVEDNRTSETDGIIIQPGDVGDEEQIPEISEDNETDVSMAPVMNLTVHRQILKLLEEAGRKGLTLKNISTRLGMFDKRTVELILYRLERYPPPSHLADLAACDFIENQGRERRHRYYTLTGYLSFIQSENIDLANRSDEYTSRDISQSGGFCPLADNLFYKDHAALIKYEDEYRDSVNPPKNGGTRKIGRPRKEGSKPRKKPVPDEGEVNLPKKSRGKGKATKPVAGTDDGGNIQPDMDKPAERGTKRKGMENSQEEDAESQPPPKKKRVMKKLSRKDGDVPDVMDVNPTPARTVQAPKKKRGHKAKETAVFLENTDSLSIIPNSADFIEPTTSNHSSEVANQESLVIMPYQTALDRDAFDVSAITSHATRFLSEPVTALANEAIPKSPQVETHVSNGVAMGSGQSERGLSIPIPYHPVPTLHSSDSSNARPVLESELSQQSVVTSSHNPSKPGAGVKRHRDVDDDAPQVDEPSANRPKSGRPKRTRELVNISQLRAENEIMRVVEESGGIANVSSNKFLEAYARVISTMAEAGEPTSMSVGTQPDRRTIRKILKRLVDRGRLKMLTTTLAPRVNQPRLVVIIYDSTVIQEKLDQYLMELQEEAPVLSAPVHKKLDKPVDYTKPKRRNARDLALNHDAHLLDGDERENRRRDLNALGKDDELIQSTLLSEPQTVAQLYGFLVGRARRARELHLFTLSHLQSSDLSSYIVSQTERIVAFPYWYHDLPVSTYFAIISATAYSPELSTLIESIEGRQTLVKDLPTGLHDELKIGRARARDKVLGLLDILASLKLVTPLRVSSTRTPDLTCESKGTHPTQFDIVPISRGKNAAPPLYWRFNTIAPIHLYTLTTPWPPPFHRDIFVRTADESMSFWFELENASLTKDFMDPTNSMDSITGPCACTRRVAHGLRRRQSWESSYVLSLNQKQYLQQQWTDPSTGYTPLSEPGGGRDRLEYVCTVLSAPIDAIFNFFTATDRVFVKEAERIRERDRRRREEEWERQATEDRALLAKKAVEARRQIEVDWDAVVSRVHPAPLPYGSVTRLKELRTRYLQSSTRVDTQKWEAAVIEAISGPKVGQRNPILPTIVSPRKPTFRVGMSNLPPATANPQKSVQELIERYKDKVAAVQAMPQKKKKKKDVTPGDNNAEAISTTDPPRRQRFQWTPEYDELARDASAILRARCRTWYRMDWTAMDQVFPFLPRNNVRQRLTTLKQEAGGESYLRLLEDKWHELWIEHRGTEALPDDNPSHPAEFDAVAHVEFLRKYIDKRALRVGLSKAAVQHAAGAVLTETVVDFTSRWRVEENERCSNKMDFMWTSIGDEHREKTLLGEAFSIMRSPNCVSISSNPLSNGVAESALKMALTTPQEEYDADDAATFLNSIGQQAVRQASGELLARGVVSETGNGHRKTPGRNLKISGLNEDALGGSFSSDFFSEACAIEDMFEDETSEWKEWSLTATNGEMAALIDLVSGRKVEFQIDASGPAAQRQQLDWNSKKVDDDQIENILRTRFYPSADVAGPSESPPDSPVFIPTAMDVDGSSSAEHGQNNGDPASCRETSEGIITCSACALAEQRAFLAELDLESRKLSSDVIEILERAGWNGLRHEALMICPLQSRDIQATIQRMSSRMPPLCYWVGYTHPVLVSQRHIARWSVSIPGSIVRFVFPRRWLNIRGENMDEVWNAGLRAVAGVLVTRPGIPQSELRQRLTSVYDRQELNDLLHYLWVEEFVAKRVAPDDGDLISRDIRAISGLEEQKVCWTLKADMWYRVNE